MAKKRTQAYYEAKWRDYRRRLTIFALVFVTFIPAGVFLAPFLSKTIPSINGEATVVFIWAVSFFASGIYMISWRCPRCRKPFFSRTMSHNPFAPRCMHCKLPKWAGAAEQ